MFLYITLGIIIICFLVIVFIVARKFRSLAAIDIKSIPSEQQAELKEKILVGRLKNKTAGFFSSVGVKLRPAGKFFKSKIIKLHEYLLELEKKYQKSARHASTEAVVEEVEQKIPRLMREAEDLAKEEKYAEAEKKYIEVISLDVKNTKAYAALGDLYFKKKDYEQAKETYEYLINIEPEVSDNYLRLGEVYVEIENNEKALENAQKAVELSPNNPRTLDFLLNIAIIVRNKKLAQETLKKLKEANPENEKLEELKEKIKDIKL